MMNTYDNCSFCRISLHFEMKLVCFLSRKKNEWNKCGYNFTLTSQTSGEENFVKYTQSCTVAHFLVEACHVYFHVLWFTFYFSHLPWQRTCRTCCNQLLFGGVLLPQNCVAWVFHIAPLPQYLIDQTVQCLQFLSSVFFPCDRKYIWFHEEGGYNTVLLFVVVTSALLISFVPSALCFFVSLLYDLTELWLTLDSNNHVSNLYLKSESEI